MEVSPTRMVYSGTEYNFSPEYPNIELPEWSVYQNTAHDDEMTMALVLSGIPY